MPLPYWSLGSSAREFNDQCGSHFRRGKYYHFPVVRKEVPLVDLYVQSPRQIEFQKALFLHRRPRFNDYVFEVDIDGGSILVALVFGS